MTKNKRFTSQRTDDYNFSDILDNGKWIGICHVDCEDDFVDKFNELYEEKEKYKSNCSEIASENSILWNEIFILREQGALPSDAFEKYLDSLKNKGKLKVILNGRD